MRRHILPFSAIFLAPVWLGGCVELGACAPGQRVIDGACAPPADPCPEEVSKPIQVGCAVNPVPPGASEIGSFSWELTVKPSGITSGERSWASFEGRMLIDAGILNLGQFLLGAHHRVGIVDAKATVQIREGAQAEGGDVVLEIIPIQKTCTYDRSGRRGPGAGPFPSCDEKKDFEDGSNDDCTGLGGVPDADNQCLSYFRYTTSDNCSDNGPCAQLGETGPSSACDRNGFCVSEALEIGLAPKSAAFIPDSSGSVLFGWGERGNVEPLEVGANRGAYDPSELRRDFGTEIVLNGLDVRLDTESLSFPLAFECIMGVNSRGPDGVPTVSDWVSPSPDGALISCPIQEPN